VKKRKIYIKGIERDGTRVAKLQVEVGEEINGIPTD